MGRSNTEVMVVSRKQAGEEKERTTEEDMDCIREDGGEAGNRQS